MAAPDLGQPAPAALFEIPEMGLELYHSGQTWIPWASAEGVVSRTLTRSLARNALVRRYTVRVGASRADRTTLAIAGQVRLQAQSAGEMVVVVDFGMLRTVSGVGRLQGAPPIEIVSLRAFRGDAFDDANLYAETGASFEAADGNTFETRTERVRLQLRTSADLATIASTVVLQFPDLPADLDIRVNDGAPAWTAPGVAQPNTRGWDANTEQVADLTTALAALTGKADDTTPLEASIVLVSRIPGRLILDDETVDIAFLARIAFDGAAETTLVFDQEGQRDVTLQLPTWVHAVQEVRLTLTATVPAERILEPVGPPLALQSGGGAAYDLLLDVDHAGAARLVPAEKFGELVAVRLPLRAGVDGAEVRALVYEGTGDAPTRAADGGTSKPVDLAPSGADTGDVWTSFVLPRPLKLDPARTYWVAVVVGRGRVTWSLGRFEQATDAVPIRRGHISGAWHELPDVMLDGATLGARVRAVGTPRPTTPVAPLSIGVAGHETAPPTDVLPTPKGVSATWLAPGAPSGTEHPSVAPDGPSSAPTITLRITARTTGTVKLSAVDVVATR